MSIAFTLESLQFYKMKSTWVVRILFLATLFFNLFYSVVPIGNRDFSTLEYFVNEVNQNMLRYVLDPDALSRLPAPLTSGNILYLGGYAVLQLINIFSLLFYSGGYAAERIGRTAGEGMKRMLTALPKVLVLISGLLLVALLSAFFFWVPLIILLCAICFAPFFYSEHRMGLIKGAGASMKCTNRRKIHVYFSFALQGLIFDLVTMLLPNEPARLQWVQPFFDTLFIFMRGRLLGLLYVFFYRQAKRVEEGAYVELDLKELLNEELKPGPEEVW